MAQKFEGGGEEWKQMTHDDGRKYYFNMKTGMTQFIPDKVRLPPPDADAKKAPYVPFEDDKNIPLKIPVEIQNKEKWLIFLIKLTVKRSGRWTAPGSLSTLQLAVHFSITARMQKMAPSPDHRMTMTYRNLCSVLGCWVFRCFCLSSWFSPSETKTKQD